MKKLILSLITLFSVVSLANPKKGDVYHHNNCQAKIIKILPGGNGIPAMAVFDLYNGKKYLGSGELPCSMVSGWKKASAEQNLNLQSASLNEDIDHVVANSEEAHVLKAELIKIFHAEGTDTSTQSSVRKALAHLNKNYPVRTAESVQVATAGEK